MLDINFIRNNADFCKKVMQNRNASVDIDAIIRLDEKRRAIMQATQNSQSQQNEIAKKIGLIKSGKQDGDVNSLMQQSDNLKKEVQELEAQNSKIQDELHESLSIIPNILQEGVPNGADENHNLEIKKWGAKPNFNFPVKQHYEIGEKSGMMDFESGRKISGSRFVVLKSKLSRLERALKNFMLDCHTKEFGYTEISVPHLVNADSMFGTGQLPKFDNGYQTTDGMYLIPTSEVPLTNIARDSILKEEDLPLRFTAYSQCFRSEAGAAGKDTVGMLRQHQFSKVELVSICTPETSKQEHERMLAAAENILQKLNLHYRVMTLCSGDTGFCASKTYDIEVWLPGQNTYREISSCSNTLDLQARRMMARYKKDGKNIYLHTLNGSGLAIGRTMIAIMENYQTADEDFEIPEALRKYMD